MRYCLKPIAYQKLKKKLGEVRDKDFKYPRGQFEKGGHAIGNQDICGRSIREPANYVTSHLNLSVFYTIFLSVYICFA